jgi:hypothetical protein
MPAPRSASLAPFLPRWWFRAAPRSGYTRCRIKCFASRMNAMRRPRTHGFARWSSIAAGVLCPLQSATKNAFKDPSGAPQEPAIWSSPARCNRSTRATALTRTSQRRPKPDYQLDSSDRVYAVSAGRAATQPCGLGQRQLAQLQQLDGLALAFRQGRQGADNAGDDVAHLARVRRGIGKGFIGRLVRDLERLDARAASRRIDQAPPRKRRQPMGGRSRRIVSVPNPMS